jgi:hypothetical protein
MTLDFCWNDLFVAYPDKSKEMDCPIRLMSHEELGWKRCSHLNFLFFSCPKTCVIFQLRVDSYFGASFVSYN